jgi:hypothetical protein
MVRFSFIIVNTLHKNDNKNNNNDVIISPFSMTRGVAALQQN